MANNDQMRTVTFTARSFDSLAGDFPLTFPVPYGDTEGGECFEYTWHLLQYVFRLPSPSSFRPLPPILDTRELRILRRYRDAASDLASSPFLRADFAIAFPGPHDSGPVEVDFPPNESIRGFSVLLRQFMENGEKASFHAAQTTLRAVNERANDEHTANREHILTEYAKAVGKLRAWQLKVLVGKRLVTEGRWQHPKGTPFPGENPSPQQLISRWNYGEHIHWGRRSHEVEALQRDPADAAWDQAYLFDAMDGLTNLFLGFSLVVASGLSGDETAPLSDPGQGCDQRRETASFTRGSVLGAVDQEPSTKPEGQSHSPC